MEEIVIVGAARTAIGKFGGTLAKMPAADIGALVIKDVLRRAGVAPAQVSEVILGQVLTAGVGQNPARQASIRAGLPDMVPAMTINKVCGSGLKAAMLGAQSIANGDSDIVVAGGMENMSAAPHVLPGSRDGFRMGDGKMIDSMVHDGLWDPYDNVHMGMTGEHVADLYKVSREDQDAFAAGSHKKAAHAMREGWFADEIIPVSIPQKKGDPLVVSKDENVREDTTPETLGKLKPAFKKDGTVTAGNAPGVNDGASALVVMGADKAAALGVRPIARIIAQATSGLDPKLLLMTPVEAVRMVAKKEIGRAHV